ncbi:MAG: cytochrome c oxidase subunit II [Gemmatimonadaceae bacterium]
MRPSALRRSGAIACASCTWLNACNGTSSYLDATGASGAHEARLGIWLTVTACIVVALIAIALVAAMMRHRAAIGDRGDEARAAGASMRNEIRGGLRWIYIGLSGTLIVLGLTFAGTMVTFGAVTHPPRSAAVIMDVTGHQWWWEIRYTDVAHPERSFITANEVHLPIGVPVRVMLHSADVIHSFWLPQIAGKTDVIPGQTNEMWVEARVPGTTRGMCAEYCGLEHAVMALVVTAQPRADFDAWMRDRAANASVPVAPVPSQGAVVFAASCGGCHAVEGSRALGRAGPELTHIASRATIGAGALENTPANMRRWIANAPSEKEGVRMPEMHLTGGQLDAVVAYLQQLR